MSDKILAIVNPAAGGGRSAKLAGAELARLREKGLRVDAIASMAPGHAGQLAQEAYEQGYRRFVAVGGDGTAHEIINGIFSREGHTERVALAFLLEPRQWLALRGPSSSAAPPWCFGGSLWTLLLQGTNIAPSSHRRGLPWRATGGTAGGSRSRTASLV